MLAIVAALVAGSMFIGLAAAAILEPDSGPGHGLVDIVEDRIRQNEALHYQIHSALGWAFSLCPCTAALAESQRVKAGFHRPRPGPGTP